MRKLLLIVVVSVVSIGAVLAVVRMQTKSNLQAKEQPVAPATDAEAKEVSEVFEEIRNMPSAEDEVLKALEDHYNFYERNFKYRNAKVKNVGYRLFDVSVEQAQKDYTTVEKAWHGAVWRFELKADGSYTARKL
jgi:hypothetical protein